MDDRGHVPSPMMWAKGVNVENAAFLPLVLRQSFGSCKLRTTMVFSCVCKKACLQISGRRIRSSSSVWWWMCNWARRQWPDCVFCFFYSFVEPYTTKNHETAWTRSQWLVLGTKRKCCSDAGLLLHKKETNIQKHRMLYSTTTSIF